jgi:curved DNA-binding protein CbpA
MSPTRPCRCLYYILGFTSKKEYCPLIAKSSFKKLSLLLHPDKQDQLTTANQCADLFRLVNKANKVLANDLEREIYNKRRPRRLNNRISYHDCKEYANGCRKIAALLSSHQSNEQSSSLKPNTDSRDDIKSDAADNIYVVDYIVDMKEIDGVESYFVKWHGYSHLDNTWEPINNLSEARDSLNTFRKIKGLPEY